MKNINSKYLIAFLICVSIGEINAQRLLAEESKDILKDGKTILHFSEKMHRLFQDPKGHYLILVGSRQIKILDLKKMTIKKTIRHKSNFSMKVSSDGRYVVTVSKDKTAVIYDIRNNSLVDTLYLEYMDYKGSRAAVFSPNNRFVLINVSSSKLKRFRKEKIKGDEDYNADYIFVYDIFEKTTKVNIIHSDTIGHASFSPNSRFISTSSADGTAIIYDLIKNKRHFSIREKTSINSTHFSPDGQFVVSRSRYSFKIYDLKKGLEVYNAEFNNGYLRDPVFDPKSRYVILYSWQMRYVLIFDLRKNKVEYILRCRGIPNTGKGILISPNGRFAMIRSTKWTNPVRYQPKEGREYIKLFDYLAKKTIHTLELKSSNAYDYTFNLNGRFFIVVTEKDIQILDLINNKIRKSQELGRQNSFWRILAFSKNNHYVVIGTYREGIINIFDLSKKDIERIITIPMPINDINKKSFLQDAKISLDGKHVYVLYSRVLKVWKISR